MSLLISVVLVTVSKMLHSFTEAAVVIMSINLPSRIRCYLILQKPNTYKVFKSTSKSEKYFECVQNIKNLKAFTKLRLSDHNLMIEEGRSKRPCFRGMGVYVTHVTNSRMKFIF